MGVDVFSAIGTFAFVTRKGDEFRRNAYLNLIFVASVVIKQALHRVEGESRFYVVSIEPSGLTLVRGDIHDV